MSDSRQSGQVAVICDRGASSAAAIEAYLKTQGLEQADWYAPRDVDDVDRALRQRRFRRVIWPDLATWLEALWDGSISPAHWRAAGVTPEFADTRAVASPVQIDSIATVWEGWRIRQRRRRAVAGVLLSLVALAAAFAVLLTGS